MRIDRTKMFCMKLFGTIGGRERQTCISCKKDMSWPSRYSRIRGGNTYEQSPPPSWRRRGPARPPGLAAVASFAVVLGWPFHDAAGHHDLRTIRRFGLAAPASTVKVRHRTGAGSDHRQMISVCSGLRRASRGRRRAARDRRRAAAAANGKVIASSLRKKTARAIPTWY